MVATADFTKRVPPGAARRGTLAELMSKQKELASRQAELGQIQPIQSWTQGLAQVAGAGITGLQQRQVATQEGEARARLAELRAGINQDTGATSEQIAELGLIDEDVAEQYRREAADARAAQRQRDFDIASREDEQTFRAGESAAERQARLEQAAADRAVTTAGQQIDVQQGEVTAGETHRANVADEQHQDATLAAQAARDKAQAEQAAAALEQDRTQAEAELGKPSDPVSKAVYEFNRGGYGDKRDPLSQARLNAVIGKETALTKGMRITFDKDGNATFEQGGVEGGDVMSSTAGEKARVASIDEYRADAKAANSALEGAQSAGKVVNSAGYTGPGQAIYGTIDDMLEAGGSMLGLEAGKAGLDTPFGTVGASFPGTSTARDIIAKGGLDQVLKRVQETKGAISNAEMDTFKQASFGLNKTPESNKMLADMALAIIARANERATRAETWFKSHGGNMAGFEDREWQPYITANPLIGVDENGIPVLNKPGGPRATEPQTAAPAATEAPAAPAGGPPNKPLKDWTNEELDEWG